MTSAVYLFTGTESGERNEKVAEIKAALKKKFGSSDDFVFYADDTRIAEVVDKLRTESLFTPATFIVLRNAEQIKNKDDIELLSDWIKSAIAKKNDQSAILILESNENSIDAKIEKLIPKENKKIFWEMFENRKEQWLSAFFRKNGYSIENDAIETILDLVENNTDNLRSECGIFFLCFPKDHKITASDVTRILSHNREESAFTLFDAMCDSQLQAKTRLENALLILQKILLTKNNSFVMIIAGLSSCFRRLSVWNEIHAEGKSPDEITLRSSGFASKTARTQYSKAARIWSASQAAAISALLAKTDMEIRSSGNLFQFTQLTMMIYEIVIKNGAYCSIYEA